MSGDHAEAPPVAPIAQPVPVAVAERDADPTLMDVVMRLIKVQEDTIKEVRKGFADITSTMRWGGSVITALLITGMFLDYSERTGNSAAAQADAESVSFQIGPPAAAPTPAVQPAPEPQPLP